MEDFYSGYEGTRLNENIHKHVSFIYSDVRNFEDEVAEDKYFDMDLSA